MPTTTFDISYNALGTKTKSSLKQVDREAVFKKKEVEKTKPRSQPQRTLTSQIDEAKIKTEDIFEAYRELDSRLENFLQELRKRLASLSIPLSDNPAIQEAAIAVFGRPVESVSFDMYLAMLKLDKDLSLEQARRL